MLADTKKGFGSWSKIMLMIGYKKSNLKAGGIRLGQMTNFIYTHTYIFYAGAQGPE
jgi:hypothetical protein